jgi:Leucine-rich repeat (LRR) protein
MTQINRRNWLKNTLRTSIILAFGMGMGASCLPTFAFSPFASDIDERIKQLGAVAKLTKVDGKITEISITDGSALTAEDIKLFATAKDLTKLQILNFRVLGSNDVIPLFELKNLKSLALTNTVIDDSAVEGIVKAFPNLTDLDLSSNANMSSQVLKSISELKGLQSLLLLQNRLNDISTRKLAQLKDLKVLDLRGNMEAGDLTLEVLSGLPNLKSLKHRSTAVTDYGLELLSENGSIENLLIQDFAISDSSGPFLAKLVKLSQLEIIRCQGFGNDGVKALAGMPLQRLTLRDLPVVADDAMLVFKDMPKLKRLYLHELSGVSDVGLKNLSSVESLETLDIWSIPQMTDATVAVIARLPNLTELSIRSTAITDASIKTISQMPNLKRLTLKDNAAISPAAVKSLSDKKWEKLDLGNKK